MPGSAPAGPSSRVLSLNDLGPWDRWIVETVLSYQTLPGQPLGPPVDLSTLMSQSLSDGRTIGRDVLSWLVGDLVEAGVLRRSGGGFLTLAMPVVD